MDKQRIAVITGGTRGIGRSICIRLAKEGYKIYFSYLSENPENANKTEAQIADIGGIAKGIRTNMSNADEVQTFFKSILEEEKQIHVLVNNAGVSIDQLLVQMKESDWDHMLQVNLKGTFLSMKAVSRSMIKHRYGRIVNMSSVVGVNGNPGQAGYAASKAGIIGLSKSVALELASRNITVNVVAPGFIQTDMTAEISEKAKDQICSRIPSGRIGQPDDISGVVAFLVSEDASYITGQVIHVNGGLYT